MMLGRFVARCHKWMMPEPPPQTPLQTKIPSPPLPGSLPALLPQVCTSHASQHLHVPNTHFNPHIFPLHRLVTRMLNPRHTSRLHHLKTHTRTNIHMCAHIYLHAHAHTVELSRCTSVILEAATRTRHTRSPSTCTATHGASFDDSREPTAHPSSTLLP